MTPEEFDWDAFESDMSYDTITNIAGIQSQTLEAHSIVEGIISSISKREFIVNIGSNLEGVIPATEFRYNPEFQVGDKIEVYIECLEDKKGQLILSHRKARAKQSWKRINIAYKDNETLSCYVKSSTKGGMIVDLLGIEAFLPGSQIDIVKVYDLDSYIGKNLDVKIIKIDEEFRNVVVSHKIIVSENLQKKESDKSLLKEIWQKHTEVQEQILRHRTTPIAIDPTKSEIINEKLHLVLNTSDNTDKIKNAIIEALNITEEDCHFDDGYIIAPISNWLKVEDSIKTRLSTRANKEYVSFSFNPVIDGKITDRRAQFTEVQELLDKLEIDYDFDKNKRLQISINELNRLKNHEDFNKLRVSLPDTASAIIQIYPSILYYLERICPKHDFKNIERFIDSERVSGGVIISKELVVEGGYFNKEVLDELNEVFNLRMRRVEFDFKINEEALSRYDWKKNTFGLPKEKDGVITFRKKIKSTELPDLDFEVDSLDLKSEAEYFNSQSTDDFQFEYTLNCRIVDKIFGKGNYEVTERYFYEYKENRNWATTAERDRFNDQVHFELQNKGFGIERTGASLGIDFNWKETSLPCLLTELSKEYGFIDFGLRKRGHKCNFDIKYSQEELSEILKDLHDSFDDINIEIKKKGAELSFFKEFKNIEDLLAFRPLLIQKLNSFDPERYSYTISDIPSDCVKLLYYFDKQSRDEDRIEAIHELRGADFIVDELSIGKLIRISGYPEIVIDISGENYEITKQLFEESNIEYIIPDLSGDLEKLARLKESLNRIIEGRDIENLSLGEFIFDASRAASIQNFDEALKLELQEISKHILNKKIDCNQPQKIAIAKALLAPDLALIQGPPGTGKSTAIAEMIWQHTRKFPKKKILLTSETNLAVDNAIDRVVNNQHNLIKPIRIGDDSRLESEGLQFSYSAMYRWAKGKDWRQKTSTKRYDDDADEDDDEIMTTIEETIYEAPEKLILLNWMDNIGRRIDQQKMPSEAQELWMELLKSPTSELKDLFFENYVANCNVIGATCSSIGQKNIILSESMSSGKRNHFIPTKFYSTYRQIFGKKDGDYNPKIRFDMVIQDESSKATPAELSLPLIYGEKNVIIGDHRQLPPMLSRESFINSFDYIIKREKNEVEKVKLNELRSYVLKNFKALEISHFERLFYQIDTNLKGVFNYQFRMHPAINDVIKQFYKNEGGLECGLISPIDLGVDDPDYINNGASRYHGITAGPINPDTHVLWIDSSSPEMLDGTSRVNYGEVEIIKKLLLQLSQSESFKQYTDSWSNIEDKQIGLISFYGKQLRLLKEMTQELASAKLPVRVSTVDRFQGMERNIIIVSMVRSHCIQTEKGQKPDFTKYPDLGYLPQKDLGFAQSPNRLNVALSRAKRLLIIVGDSKLFRTMEIYDNVYTTISDPQNKYGKVITAQEYGL